MFGALGIASEILVADNRSTDAIPEIVKKRAVRDKRIPSVHQSGNIGGYGNFHRCYRQSRGPFAIRVRDDDLLFPEAVMGYVERLRKSPGSS